MDEFTPCLAAPRIERANTRAARAQEILDFLVILGLLADRARFARDNALYSPVIREVESLYRDREMVIVNNLPADVLRPVCGDLLFACQVPIIGNKASVYAPWILARTAIDAANRLVDSMKVRKSDLRVDAVIARLRREVEIRRRQR